MGSVFQSLPLLRKAAPRLSKQFFTCHAPRSTVAVPKHTPKILSQSALLRAFRLGGRKSSTISPSLDSALRPSPSPLASLANTISNAQTNKRFFPETSDKIVAYWLLGSAASVFGIVVFGGLTRLTESGYTWPITSCIRTS